MIFFQIHGAMSKIWCQIVVDVLNKEIRQVENPRETGIRGAAMIAAVALRIYEDFPMAAKQVKIVKTSHTKQ